MPVKYYKSSQEADNPPPQEGGDSAIDPKSKAGKNFEVKDYSFGTTQQPDSDSDGLPNTWEDNQGVDGNEEGQLHGQSTGLGEVGGNDRLVSLGDHKYQPSPSRPSPIVRWILGGIILVLLLLVALALNANNPTAGGGTTATATSQGGGQLDVTSTSQGGGQLDVTSTSQGGGQRDVTPTSQGGGVAATRPPTQPPAVCAPGWLPTSGCACCGTTLTCADGTVAQFNPKCGVGGNSCPCKCDPAGGGCVDCNGKACTP